MATQNPAVIFAALPTGYPIPGEHLVYQEDRSIDLDHVPLHGGVLSKAVFLAIDPYLRTRMPYAYTVGEPMLGWGVGIVLRSDREGFKPGDHVCIEDYPFEEYTVFNRDAKLEILKDEGLPWSTHLGALGLAGRTGWIGYKAYVKAEKGETIYVSSASGVVGSIVCQLAKEDGLKVVASAGSEDKVEFLRKELGVDVAFNYKTQDLDQVLKEHGPIDVFWDSVGGETLERVINHMNTWGRIIICGFSSEYNTPNAYGIKNTRTLLFQSITVYGLNVVNATKRFGDFDFHSSIKKRIQEGKLKLGEQVSTKLSEAPQLLLDVLQGRNTGKPIINLA